MDADNNAVNATLLKDARGTAVYLVLTLDTPPRWAASDVHRLVGQPGQLRQALAQTRAMLFPGADASAGLVALLRHVVDEATLVHRLRAQLRIALDARLHALPDEARVTLDDGCGEMVSVGALRGLFPPHVPVLIADLSAAGVGRSRQRSGSSGSTSHKRAVDEDDTAALVSIKQPRPSMPRYAQTVCFADDTDAFGWLQGLGEHRAQLTRDEAGPRVACPRCKHSGKIYCKLCLHPLTPLPTLAALPLRLVILKHAGEHNGKSTAVHAKILAPNHTEVIEYPAQFSRAELFRVCGLETLAATDEPAAIQKLVRETVVLFPSPDAVRYADLPDDQRLHLRQVIVLDGTWTSVRKINDDLVDCLGGIRLRSVTLSPTRGTHFWRSNGTADTSHLATIEAMYYFEHEVAELQGINAAELDHLLLLFAHQHHIISSAMRERAARDPRLHKQPENPL